jgi:hypothetical protein
MNRNLRQLLQDFARPVAVPMVKSPAVPAVKQPPIEPAKVRSIRPELSGNSRTLRAERKFLLMRYDHYALPPAIYQVLIALERELSWREHREVKALKLLRREKSNAEAN